MDHFSTLATLIVSRTPPIDNPWLTAPPPTPGRHCAAVAGKAKADIQNKSDTSESQQTDELKADLTIDDVMITSSREHYLPVAIKKTVITPKKRKR